MQKKIEKLRNHYILCGWGAVGREIVTELQRAGVPFVPYAAVNRKSAGGGTPSNTCAYPFIGTHNSSAATNPINLRILFLLTVECNGASSPWNLRSAFPSLSR